MQTTQPSDGTSGAPPEARVTLINLKGTPEQADWLEGTHRKTYLAKSTILRLALALWAQTNGHPPFPMD